MPKDHFWIWTDRGGSLSTGRLAEEMREALGESDDDGGYLPDAVDEATIRAYNAAIAKSRKAALAAQAARIVAVGTVFHVDLEFERAYLESGDRQYLLSKRKMPLDVWNEIEVGAKVEFEPSESMEARRARVVY